MSIHSKCLKNLLTTTSLLSVLASSSAFATGVTQITTGPLSDGFNTQSHQFNNGDAIQFGTADPLDLSAQGFVIRAIDLNNFAAGPANVSGNTTIGSMVDVAGTAAGTPHKLDVNISGTGVDLWLSGTDNNSVFTANANDYSGLGNINIRGNNRLIINSPGAVFGGKIDGEAMADGYRNDTQNGDLPKGGNIDINNTQGVVFNGEIGSTLPINALNLQNASASLNADATFTVWGISIDNAQAEVQATKNVNFTNGSIINFMGDGMITFKGDQDRIINTSIYVAKLDGEQGNQQGEVEKGSLIYEGAAGHTLSIQGNVGGSSERNLKLIQATGGGNLSFKPASGSDGGEVNVRQIDMRGSDGTLTLNAQNYYGQFLHDPNKGIIHVSDEGTDSVAALLFDSATFSAPNNQIDSIVFTNLNPNRQFNVLGLLGTDVYAVNGIKTDSPGKGILLFRDPSVVDATIGEAEMPIGGIGLQFDNTTVELRRDVYLGGTIGGIALYDNSTVKIGANITGKVFGAGSDDSSMPFPSTAGNVEFINSGPSTLTGEATFLKALNVSGSDVTVTGQLETQALAFTNAGQNATLTAKDFVSIGAGGITNTPGGVHTIALDKNINLNGAGSSVAAPIVLNNWDSSVNIGANNISLNASINSANATQGNINVFDDITGITFNQDLGNVNPLRGMNLNKNTAVTLNANANFSEYGINIGEAATLTLAAGKNLNLTNNANINFQGNGTLLLEDQFPTLNANIFNNTNNTGAIKYSGTAGQTLKIVGNLGGNIEGTPIKLALLEAKGGGNVDLKGGNIGITTLDMTGGDGTLILNTDSNYAFNLAHDPNTVTMVISDVGTVHTTDENGVIQPTAAYRGFRDGSVISSASNPLKEIKFYNTDPNVGVNLFGSEGESGIKIYASKITTDTAGKGLMVFFGGDNVIDAPIGTSALPLYSLGIETPDPTKHVTLTLMQPAYFTGGAGLANSTLRINDTFQGSIIGIGNPGNPIVIPAITGVVEFINSAAGTTFTGSIGAAPTGVTLGGPIKPVELVKISGSDVTVTGAVNTQQLDFASATASTLTVGGALTVGTGGVTTQGDLMHTIAISEDFSSENASIGSATNRLKAVKLLNDNIVHINSDNFYSGIATATDGKGKVEFVEDGSFSFSIGEDAAKVSEVKFSQNATVKGDTFANNINVTAGKVATFDSGTGSTKIITTALTLADVGSNAIFGEGINITGPIVTGKADIGTITFQGNAIINDSIGSNTNKVASITFANDLTKIARLKGDVQSGLIIADNSYLKFEQNLTMTGNMTGNNTVFDLSNNTVTYSGAANLTGNVVVKTTYDGTKGGNIVVTNGSTLDFSSATKASVMLNANTSDADINNTVNYVLFTPQGTGTISQSNIVYCAVTDTNPNVGWKYDNATYTLTRSSNATNPNQGGGNQNMMMAGGAGTGESSSGSGNSNDAVSIAGAGDNATGAATTGAENAINNQLNGGTSGGEGVASGEGVAGGDEGSHYGVWGSPFYSIGNQKARNQNIGYKTIGYGGTIGFDTMINDDVVIGAAFTDVKSNVKFKNRSRKTTANTMLFSLYGKYSFAEAAYVQAIGTMGVSRVKHKSSPSAGEFSAKSNSTSYGIQVLGGYNYKISESTVLTPMAGLRYSGFNEKGFTLGAITLKKRNTNKFEGIVGAKLAMPILMDKGMITPDIHGFVNYDFDNKHTRLAVMIDGMGKPLPIKNGKPPKAWYSIGAGLRVACGMMEYGASYDASLANKYVGHQGTLKVRVNF